jgi:DNA adenine methylase
MTSNKPCQTSLEALSPQVWNFPSTRFMGSKEKLLAPLWGQVGRFRPVSVLDLCSGSGVVSYMLKAQGCRVVSNDYMAMAATISRALVSNNDTRLSPAVIESIAASEDDGDAFVQRTYGDLYFGAEDTAFIDCARTAIERLDGAQRDLATAALIRACVKRRPRGIFTYTGSRYDDGRRDLKLTLREHFRAAAGAMNAAVFSNERENEVFRRDISTVPPEVDVDLVYLDPPYFSPLSDNEYVRRYHFVEALACGWTGVEIQFETKTRKIRNYPTPFRTEAGTASAFEALADFYRGRPLLISYSSNARPQAEDTITLLRRHRKNVDLVEVDHRYSFGNQGHLISGAKNQVKELIFVAY